MYGGKDSSEFIGSWKRSSQSKNLSDRTEYSTRWLDTDTGLSVTATTIAFKDFPAVDWVLRFESTGTKDTPIIEQIKALDIVLDTKADQVVILDQINGDDCSERSFVPVERSLGAGQGRNFAPVGGRPSNGEFPFFNVQLGGEGFFTAIGWTGQWAVSVRREDNGATNLRAGMQLTHLLLHPGEAVRTPRIMLLRWSGNRTDAHNSFRRLLMAHYVPRLNDEPVTLAVTAQTFNRWAAGARPNWATEQGQIAAARINSEIGCNTHWFDAGWFEGKFPNSVGNWFPKPKDFPNGLRPIGDTCESLGLKFLVWYEPERVGDGTVIARKHPEFVLPANKRSGKGGLFNLGDPKARRWLTDLLVRQIQEFNIHTYRNDFNIDPLPFWRGNDAPDRHGMTEIRYVEGLYAMWDELRQKYPDMYLDNCASGGRRIDLETVMRAVVQTRSDTACMPGREHWDQAQAYGLSLYLPQHSTIGWTLGAYHCRSSAAAGYCGEYDVLDDNFDITLAAACIREIKENQPYWNGDFYPLTPWSIAEDQWISWQLHLSKEARGIILAFRREHCQYNSIQVNLQAIEDAKQYEVDFINDDHKVVTAIMTGHEFASLEIRLPKPYSSMLIRYRLTEKQ